MMHGAALLYNLILAEQVQNEELVETYRENFASWTDTGPSAAGGCSGVTESLLRCTARNSRDTLELVTVVNRSAPKATATKIGECKYAVPVRGELNP